MIWGSEMHISHLQSNQRLHALCHKFAKPQEQVMADLPFACLQLNTHPFAHTGVDSLGPE